jgi:4-hydroxybenzoyl-CoA reductase subunit beta
MGSSKTYLKASSISHAISLAKETKGSFRYLAGGTDLIVNILQGNDDSALIIDISGIDELKEIAVTETHLVIGSLVCLDDLKNEIISHHFPIIAQAAHSVASPTIRKTATLGGNLLCENRCSFYNQSEWWREAAGGCLKSHGNICLASGGSRNCFSKFVSDMAVALISLQASMEWVDENGSSTVSLESIYSGDGVNPRRLSKTAIIKSIFIPLDGDTWSVYKKLRKRETLDFTSLTMAISINKAGRIRIVLGGVHAKPVIAEGRKGDDMEKLISQAVSSTRVIDNDTYSRAYRREMIGVFLNRGLNELKVNLSDAE